MMILQTGKRTRIEQRRAAFTLIELVLVMAILIIVMSMSGTSLTSFFKGRALDAEAKRFLALTRHAQNRAVSEGVPMHLWIDTKQRKYGLEIAPGFVEDDPAAKEFNLARDLEIEVTVPPALPQGLMTQQIARTSNDLLIKFAPDEYIDETNPELITIKEKDGEAVYIVPDRNRLTYEITTNQFYIVRR